MASQVSIESEIVYTSLGATPKPPVDLYQIADDIRVGAIRDTDFRAGFTDFNLAVPVIYVATICNWKRRNVSSWRTSWRM